MSSPLKLSVIVITRNEEKDIAGCLDSVKSISDEIILVDSGSTDRTVEIAKSYQAKTSYQEWLGYSLQKQMALNQATGDWVLNIDADERVSPELRDEIKQILSNPSPDKPSGYEIPYRHFFLGKQLRFGGLGGETHVRFFKRNGSRYGNEKVHEGIQVDGSIGRLKNPIEHTSYRDLSDYLTKCNLYTSLIAEAKAEKGERFHFWHHLRLPYEFLVRYFFKLGFLDGQAGLVYAVLSSYYIWLKYLKLRDLEGQKT